MTVPRYATGGNVRPACTCGLYQVYGGTPAGVSHASSCPVGARQQLEDRLAALLVERPGVIRRARIQPAEAREMAEQIAAAVVP